MQLQTGTALAVARLLRLREAVPGLKAVIRIAAEDKTYLREAMQALHSIGVEDDYWVKCLETKSRNGRDYIACAALCEVWDSPSKVIQTSIAGLQKDIQSRKDVDFSIGLPAAFEWVRIVKPIDQEYKKSTTQKRLRLVEEALRKSPTRLSGKWHKEYKGTIGDDYNYVHVRWGAERLRELSRERPDDVAKYIVALPNRHTKELRLKDEELPKYREYLLQWVTAKVRKAVRKKLRPVKSR